VAHQRRHVRLDARQLELARRHCRERQRPVGWGQLGGRQRLALVAVVAPGVEARDRTAPHPQRRRAGLAGRRVEQTVADVREHGRARLVAAGDARGQRRPSPRRLDLVGDRRGIEPAQRGEREVDRRLGTRGHARARALEVRVPSSAW
jgi:hypothetical protein